MNLDSIKSTYKNNAHKKSVKSMRVYEPDKNVKTKNKIIEVVSRLGEIRIIELHLLINKSVAFTQMCVRCLIREKKLKRIKKPIGHHNTCIHYVRLSNDCSQ